MLETKVKDRSLGKCKKGRRFEKGISELCELVN